MNGLLSNLRAGLSAFLRHGCAVITVALAIGGRLLLDPLLGDKFLLALPLFAILLTARFGGFGPAFVAVVFWWSCMRLFPAAAAGQLATS